MTAIHTRPDAGSARRAGTDLQRILDETFVGPRTYRAGPDRAGPDRAGPVDEPLVLAHAVSTADMACAVRAARETGVPLVIRGGGHGQLRSPAGRLVVDTGHLADVQVFPHRRVAAVGPGARWHDVMRAATPHGLAPLCGNALDVGVVGYTLGGGVGWLSRQFGYTADNVTRIEALLADGTSVTATHETETELFWGLRGAGANLAVTTRLEVRLAPVAHVTAGEVEYPWERAADVLDAFARQSPPDHLTTVVVLNRSTVTRPPAVTVQAVSTADPATARAALRDVLPAGDPVRDTVGPAHFREAGTLGGTAPLGFELLDAIGPDVVGHLLDATRAGTDEYPTRLEVRYWGGVPSRAEGGGPVGHRHVPFSVTVDGPPDVVSRVAALGTGRSFLNFLRDVDRTATAYTAADHDRLRQLKATVDPANILGSQHNIPPA